MVDRPTKTAVVEPSEDEIDEWNYSNYSDQCLLVEGDDTDTVIPITGVEVEWFEEHGSLSALKVEPEDTFDITRVYEEDGTIYGEAWVSPIDVVEITDGGTCTYYRHPERTPEDENTLWTSPTKAEQELTMLVENGLSAAEALDYWMIYFQHSSSTEWSEHRGCSQQAVSENFRKANAKLTGN